MKKLLLVPMMICGALGLSAADLKQSKFTQVINEVKVLESGAQQPKPAKVQEVFKTPDILRTGANSRAELQAPDQTLTRVGANTVFSFEPTGRNIKLEQGSLLFHSPKGKGGGNIKTAGATAAVTGTTLVVVALPNGGFKVIFLEGRGRVTLANGKSTTLRAGQMVIVGPNDTTAGPVLDIDLGQLVDGSFLVKGFASELPSWEEILDAVERQRREIARGRYELADNQEVSGNNDPKGLDPILFESGTGHRPHPEFRGSPGEGQGSPGGAFIVGEDILFPNR